MQNIHFLQSHVKTLNSSKTTTSAVASVLICVMNRTTQICLPSFVQLCALVVSNCYIIISTQFTFFKATIIAQSKVFKARKCRSSDVLLLESYQYSVVSIHKVKGGVFSQCVMGLSRIWQLYICSTGKQYGVSAMLDLCTGVRFRRCI